MPNMVTHKTIAPASNPRPGLKCSAIALSENQGLGLVNGCTLGDHTAMTVLEPREGFSVLINVSIKDLKMCVGQHIFYHSYSGSASAMKMLAWAYQSCFTDDCNFLNVKTPNFSTKQTFQWQNTLPP